MAKSNFKSHVARDIAAALSLGGLYFSVVLFPLIRDSDNPLAYILFGPGYIVTAGYVLRTVATLSLPVRRLIWSASLLVQGGWLLFHVVASVGSPSPLNQLFRPMFVVAWLCGAVVLSCVALSIETPDVAEVNQ